MADLVRQSQEILEIASDIEVEVRQSQDLVEICHPRVIETVSTQAIVETLSDIIAESYITQNVIEIIPVRPDVSGVYFINVGKVDRHDTYYGDREVPGSPQVQKKIPDPTIRTALIGE